MFLSITGVYQFTKICLRVIESLCLLTSKVLTLIHSFEALSLAITMNSVNFTDHFHTGHTYFVGNSFHHSEQTVSITWQNLQFCIILIAKCYLISDFFMKFLV